MTRLTDKGAEVLQYLVKDYFIEYHPGSIGKHTFSGYYTLTKFSRIGTMALNKRTFRTLQRNGYIGESGGITLEGREALAKWEVENG